MPLFLLAVGGVLIVSGVLGTTQHLGSLLSGDFSGPGNFTTWIVALVVAGLLGYIPGFKPVAYGLIVLIMVAIFLQNGTGFFDQFQKTAKELNT